jgi:hypothetical protein
MGEWLDSTSEFRLRTLSGEVAGTPLVGSGSVYLRPEATFAAARVTVGPQPVDGLLRLVPDSYLEGWAAYSFAGDARVDVTIDGAFDSLMAGSGRAEVVWLGGAISDTSGELLGFESLSLPMDARGFHVDAVGVRSRYGPLQIAAVGTWPPEGRLEASISGELDVAVFATDSVSLVGLVGWSASAQGPMMEPADWRVRARAATGSLSIEEPGRLPFVISRSEASYDGKDVTIQSFDAAYAMSRLSATGVVGGLPWRGYIQNETPADMQARLDLKSPRLNLDALFPQLAGDSAAPTDTSSRPPLPLGHTVLNLRADTVIVGGATWTGMTAKLTWQGGTLTVDTLHGRVYGGRANLSGRVDSALNADAPYAFSVQIDSLDVGELLSRFGGAGKHLKGRGSLVADITGRGATPEEMLQRLAVDGTASLFDAELVNLGAAVRVQELLGQSPRDPLPLKSRWNSFRVEEGRTRMDDFKFNTLDGSWVLAGSAGLDGTLDYALDGTLSAAVSSTLSLPDTWFSALPETWRSQIDPVDLLKNDAGEAEFFLHVGGTLTQPSVSIDWSRLQPVLTKRFEKRVKDRLTEEAKTELKKGLQDLFNKLKR